MWYHGTNQTIVDFKCDPEIQGSNTGGYMTQGMIYFSDSPKLADGYAKHAESKLYAFDHRAAESKLESYLNQYNQLMDCNKFDDADAVCQEMEDYDSYLRETKAGAVTYPVHIVAQKVKTVDFNGEEWGGEKADRLIEMARNRKLDALFIANAIDNPSLTEKAEPCTLCIVFNDKTILPSLSLSPEERLQVEKKAISPEMINKSIARKAEVQEVALAG